MNTRPSPSCGLVADRIQKFQGAQDSTPVTAPTRNPLVEIPAEELRAVTARGRQKEGNLCPPTITGSRDGAADGAHRDGSPPVGSLNQPLHPSMAQAPILPPRTAMSLARQSPSHKDHFSSSDLPSKSPRKHGVMEEMTESTTDITTARSRLRCTAENREPVQNRSPNRAYTLAELGDMIDNVIEEHTADAPVAAPGEISGRATPQTTLIRRWKSERSPRRPIANIAFHPPPQTSVPGILNNISRPQSSHDAANPHVKSSRHAWTPARISLSKPQLDSGFRSGSPVRQRAALFETMQESVDESGQACEHPHDPHIHVKKEWSVVPLHEYSAEKEKELHSLKFGKTVYEKSANTAAAETLSHPVHDRTGSTDSSRNTHEIFNTAKQSLVKGGHVADGTLNINPQPPAHARKTSMGWPFKWSLFSKASSVPPQTDEDVVGAIPNKDEHRLPTKPSTVRSKVQELLKRDEEEHSRKQFELQYKSKRPSRNPGTVTHSVLGEPVPEAPLLKPAQLPPLQIPPQEETELMATPIDSLQVASSSGAKGTTTTQGDSFTTPKTPLHRSWNEKEVLDSSKPQSQDSSARPESPVKPPPSTPGRCRSKKLRQSMSPRGSPYTTEQTFILSPVPSRSQSRASSRSRVHRVEVEMRDSPAREGRERGEKVLFVRTEAFEEIEE